MYLKIPELIMPLTYSETAMSELQWWAITIDIIALFWLVGKKEGVIKEKMRKGVWRRVFEVVQTYFILPSRKS
jgi:hypothetical protein